MGRATPGSIIILPFTWPNRVLRGFLRAANCHRFSLMPLGLADCRKKGVEEKVPRLRHFSVLGVFRVLFSAAEVLLWAI
jgi:hypothetical protein